MRGTDLKRLAAAVSAAALLACAGGGGGGTTGGGGGAGQGPETEALFCEAMWSTFAQRYADCWKAPLAWATEFVDPAKQCAGPNYAVTYGLATYDRAAAGRCLAFFETATCTDLRGFRDDVVDVPDCRAAVVGKTAPGGFQGCMSDAECTSALCSGGGNTCPGSCMAGAAAGQGCAMSRDCARGLYCYHGTLWADRTCQPFSNRPGEGQECSVYTGCKPGLYCTGYFGTCARQVSAGACTVGKDGEMAPGYGCFSGTAAPLVGPGLPCEPTADHCGLGAYCTDVTKVCAQEPLVGEACVAAADNQCIGGYCNLSASPPTCAFDVAASTSCTTNLDCRSDGYCDSGCQWYCI